MKTVESVSRTNSIQSVRQSVSQVKEGAAMAMAMAMAVAVAVAGGHGWTDGRMDG